MSPRTHLNPLLLTTIYYTPSRCLPCERNVNLQKSFVAQSLGSSRFGLGKSLDSGRVGLD